MPRALREKTAPWASASVAAVVSFAALLLRGATMPDPDTELKAAIVMWFGLILLEWILGAMRRHSEHWFVQYGAMAGHYLPFPLAIFATNTVRYSDSDGGHILAVIMVVLCSYAGTMNVYTTLGDSRFGGWRFVRTSFCLFSLWRLAAKLNTEKNEKGQALSVAEFALFIFIPMFVAVPYSMSRISSRQVQGAKACADSMEEAKLPSPFFSGDANNSQYGCKYLLTVKSLDSWSSGINMNDTPDISISYTFFRLLTKALLWV